MRYYTCLDLYWDNISRSRFYQRTTRAITANSLVCCTFICQSKSHLGSRCGCVNFYYCFILIPIVIFFHFLICIIFSVSNLFQFHNNFHLIWIYRFISFSVHLIFTFIPIVTQSPFNPVLFAWLFPIISFHSPLISFSFQFLYHFIFNLSHSVAPLNSWENSFHLKRL